jgi:4-alpha-glucanotransferase
LRYLNRNNEQYDDIAWELLRLAWSSAAALAIAPLQDLLNLGSEARMNLPGSSTGNWRWRPTKHMLNRSVFGRLRDLTGTANRLRESQSSVVLRQSQQRSASG